MTVPTLDPSTPFGYAELLVRNRIHRVRARVIRGPRDLGASAVEWVIISALVIGVCVAVSAALKTKLTTQVNNLNVGDQT
jgi:Flp pilus assembly pilin Flp